MGGVWHFLYLSHSSKSKKHSTRRRHHGDLHEGMEAPRRSMELSFERGFSCNGHYDNVSLPRQGSHHSRMAEDFHGSPTKSLTDEETSGRSSTSSRPPSVIARLMGMDAFPSGAKPSSPKESNYPNSRNDGGTMTYGSIGPSTHKLQNTMPIKKRNKELNPHSHSKSYPTTGYGRSSKPKPREHPQEEQLQKFKKEFEAWQLNRPWDCPKSMALEHNLPQGGEKQKLTGMINKEKMASTADVSLYNGSTPELLNNHSTIVAVGKQEVSKEKKVPASGVSSSKEKSRDMKNDNTMDRKTLVPNFHHEGFTNRQRQPHKPPAMASRTRRKVSGRRLSSITESDEENFGSASPTKIVILKPDFEDISDTERTWCPSPQMAETEGSMDTFLEEVKEKLRMEIQGKPRHGVSLSCDRLGNFSSGRSRRQCSSPEVIEREINVENLLGDVKDKLRMEVQGQPQNKASPSSLSLENFSMVGPSSPKQIARQTRESVSRDVHTTMMSSELVRSGDSGAPSGKSDSINRDGGGLLSESFRSVLLSNGDHAGFAITNDEAIAGDADFSREKSRTEAHTANGVEKSLWDNRRSLIGGKTSSFREEDMNGATLSGDLSPRSLVRSMSAPASGAVVQRLLSNEQDALLRDHVPRKGHEKCEDDPSDSTKKRRDGVNFKRRISSLKHSLALKGKIFSKKSPHAQKYTPPNSDLLHGSTAAPSILENNVGIPEENISEVPPSPASMSSGSLEDFGKPGQPSPISPLEIPFNGHSSPQNIKDVKDSPKILAESPLQTMEEDVVNEASLSDDDEIAQVWDQDEVYIRAVLVRADLYGKMSAGKEFPRWKMLCESIPNCTFADVEEAYDKCENTDAANFLSESPMSRKLLFDLLNEALPRLLEFPSTELGMERFRRRLDELHGKKLLHDAWQEILASTQALDEEDFSLDRVMEQDLLKTHWSSMSCDVKGEIAMDLESTILSQLLDDLALEVCGLS